MKKFILILFATGVVVLGLFFVIGQNGIQALGIQLSPSAAVSGEVVEKITATPLPAVISTNEINASGKLVPAKFIDLSFQSGGVVAAVLAEEGQKVETDQVIARLGDEVEIDYEISQAQLDVLNAQKTLDDLNLKAPMAAAQAKYDIVQVQKELEKAIKRRTAMEYPKATQKDIDKAYRSYRQAEDILKDNAELAASTDKTDQTIYKAAEKERDYAWANYNWLITPYTEKEKAEQDTVIELNQQKIDDLKKKYSIYTQGPDPEEVNIAQAQLNVAKNRLAVAKEKKTRLELRAPFTGIIVNLGVKIGQMVTAGETILTLADFSHWHIETEDLTELSVTRVSVGAPVEVKIDSLPDQTFNGKVIAIQNYGIIKKGDMTYTVVVEIENTDARLRWNMTSPITIWTK
jgi:HlyD family secretion protein